MQTDLVPRHTFRGPLIAALHLTLMSAHERIRARVSLSPNKLHISKLRSQGISIYRPIVWGNSAWTLSPEERATLPQEKADHTHRWTVSVRSAASLPDQVGGADDITHFIKRVTFKLHETYVNATRSTSPIVLRLTLPVS